MMVVSFFSEVVREVKKISWVDKSSAFSLSLFILVFCGASSLLFLVADYVFLNFLKFLLSVF
jgi:preprotein translocase SecE subunit